MEKIGFGCGCGLLCGGLFAALVGLIIFAVAETTRAVVQGVATGLTEYTEKWAAVGDLFGGIRRAAFPDFLSDFAVSVALFFLYLFTGQ